MTFVGFILICSRKVEHDRRGWVKLIHAFLFYANTSSVKLTLDSHTTARTRKNISLMMPTKCDFLGHSACSALDRSEVDAKCPTCAL
jgi:hypothetical protein